MLEELRPGATRALARAADLARHDRQWLDPLVDAALAGVVAEGPTAAGDAAGDATAGAVALLGPKLADLPPGLGRRVVRAACARAGCPCPSADTTDRVLALARPTGAGPAPVRWPGAAASRAGDLVVLAREEQRDSVPVSTGPDSLG
jgi:hypothetical protein